MRLDSRVSKLENTLAPKQRHVFGYIVGRQTEQEALEQYCAGKGYNLEKFRNEEYGPYLVIKRTIVSPKNHTAESNDN